MPDIKSKLTKLFKPEEPNELCGLIVGNRVIKCKNIHPEPEKGFEIPVADLIKHSETMTGSWHTHPGGDSNLSERDYLAFVQYPDLTHYIISPSGINTYTVEDGIVINAN